MLDFGWVELAVIGLIALMVIGPKDLPKVLRTLGQWSRRLRSLAREFQSHVDDVIRDSDLEDVRDGINSVRRANPGRALNRMVDPDGRVAKELDDIEREARSGGVGGGARASSPRAAPLDHEGAGDPTGPETRTPSDHRGADDRRGSAGAEAAPRTAARTPDPTTDED